MRTHWEDGGLSLHYNGSTDNVHATVGFFKRIFVDIIYIKLLSFYNMLYVYETKLKCKHLIVSSFPVECCPGRAMWLAMWLVIAVVWTMFMSLWQRCTKNGENMVDE